MSAPREQRPVDTRPALTRRGTALRLVACLVISGLVWSQAARQEWDLMRWLFWTEIVLGVLAYVLVRWRRTWPLPIALTVAGLSVLSGLAAGPATLTAVSVATSRRIVPIIVVGVLNFAAAMVYTSLAPYASEGSPLVTTTINLVINAGMMGWGMYIGSRRELLWTLRERALRAEREQRLRVDQARRAERAQIAREMHDVLAHRITQVSMSAGALAFREDLDADSLRAGLSQLHERSNEALQDLRGVLGVLRDPDTGDVLDQPQPTYADVVRLVAEARRGGLRVELDDDVTDPDSMPPGIGRTLYRIVQEGLTNVQKHAPGAHLSVHLDGGPDEGVRVAVRNQLGFGRPAPPGSGLGLVGLAERAQLHGGWLDHHTDGDVFVLEAWLPWRR